MNPTTRTGAADKRAVSASVPSRLIAIALCSLAGYPESLPVRAAEIDGPVVVISSPGDPLPLDGYIFRGRSTEFRLEPFSDEPGFALLVCGERRITLYNFGTHFSPVTFPSTSRDRDVLSCVARNSHHPFVAWRAADDIELETTKFVPISAD